MAQYRRYFSVLFVKVQAACLTSRLGHFDEAARQAARRRIDLIDKKERARKEAEAYFFWPVLEAGEEEGEERGQE